MRKICRWQILPVLSCLVMAHAEEKKELLTLGTTIDLSRGLKTNGESIETALKAVFEKAHVPGYQLQLDIRDDEYDPEKALTNVKKFIKEHIDILLMPLGSAPFKAYFDLIKQGQVLVLFPNPGIPETRNKDIRYCINLRPSYKDEASALTDYVIQQLKPKKVLIFYQDDDFGKACLGAAQEKLKAANIDLSLLSYARNDLNFNEQLKKIRSADVDAIGLFITSIAAKELFLKIGDDVSLAKKQFFGVSDVGQRMVTQLIKEKAIQIIISNVVPNPEKSDLPLVKEFREQIQDHDTFSLEAYLGASLLIDILMRAKKPITKDKIIEVVESMQNYTIKGFPLHFNQEKRQLINHLWINHGKDDWEMIAIK